MTYQYLLPCTCGKKVTVGPAQAGGQVACSCGRQLTVPTLRGIKQLETASPSDSSPARPVARRWGPVRGAMFSVGLLVAVVSLLVIAYTFWEYRSVVPFTQDATAEINIEEEKQIADMDLMQSIGAFDDLRSKGLPDDVPPIWIQAQQIAQQKRTLMMWTGTLAIVGALAAVLALLIRPAR